MPRTQTIKRRDPSIFRSYIAAVLFDLPQFKGRRWISVPSELGRMLGRGPVAAMSSKSRREIRPSLAVEVGESVGVDESCVMGLLFDDPEITSIADYQKKIKRLGRARDKPRELERQRVDRAGALIPVARLYKRRSVYSMMMNSAIRSRLMTEKEAEALIKMFNISHVREYGTTVTLHKSAMAKISKKLRNMESRIRSIAAWMDASEKRHRRYDYQKPWVKHNFKTLEAWSKSGDPAYFEWKQGNERIKKARRRSVIQGAAHTPYTPLEWYARMGIFGYRCAYCGKERSVARAEGFDLTLDHVVPMPHGPDALSNTAPACHLCNTRKGTRDVMEWLHGKPSYNKLIYDIYAEHGPKT